MLPMWSDGTLCLEVSREEESERDMAASATVEDYVAKFEQEFSLVSIDSSIGNSVF